MKLLILLFNLLIGSCIYGIKPNPIFKQKYAVNLNFGLSGVSYNNGTRLQLGALTPSVNFYYKGKYSLLAEYFDFNYVYGIRHNPPLYLNNYGQTRQIESKTFKLALGKLYGNGKRFINPYASVNYRFSRTGHEFYWPIYNNPNHNLTIAHSPFKSLGLGLGTSINASVYKLLNLSFDVSVNRYFDHKRIYAPTEYASADYSDVSNSWSSYKPLNTMIVLQMKVSFMIKGRKTIL